MYSALFVVLNDGPELLGVLGIPTQVIVLGNILQFLPFACISLSLEELMLGIRFVTNVGNNNNNNNGKTKTKTN